MFSRFGRAEMMPGTGAVAADAAPIAPETLVPAPAPVPVPVSPVAAILDDASREALGLLLPGIVQVRTIRMPLYGDVKTIRLSLPHDVRLAIRNMDLPGVSSEQLASAHFHASPSKGDTDPALARTYTYFETLQTFEPFWSISFDQPVPAREFTARTLWYDVPWRETDWTLSIEGADGSVRHVHNCSREVLNARLEPFNRQVRLLTDELRACGLACDAAGLEDAHQEVAAKVEAVFGGEVPPAVDSGLARLRLLASVVTAFENLPSTSPSAMAAAGALLDVLLARSASLRTSPADPNELRATAIIFLRGLIRKDAISKRELAGYRLFLRNTRWALAVEAELNRLYAAKVGTAGDLPILFRSHGLAKDRLLSRADAWVDAMRRISEELNAIGYQCAICYGPLLGAVRNGRFIRHDDDADMTMLFKTSTASSFKAELDEVAALLSARGFRVAVHRLAFLKVAAPGFDQVVDVFPLIDEGGAEVAMHMEGVRVRAVPRSMVLPFGTIEFYGQTFRAPADPEAFLRERYGADWRKPKRTIAGRWVASEE